MLTDAKRTEGRMVKYKLRVTGGELCSALEGLLEITYQITNCFFVYFISFTFTMAELVWGYSTDIKIAFPLT